MSSITISQAPDSSNLYLYPNSSVATEMTAVGQVLNHECVDEEWTSPNDDTDYVFSTSTDSVVTDFYGLPNHTTETGTINYVKVVAVVSSGPSYNQSSDGTYRLLLQDATDSTVSYGGNQAPVDTTYKKYYEIFTSCPTNPGGGWTWTDIDDLNVGIDLSSPTVSDTGTETLRPDSTIFNEGSVWTASGDSTIHACVDEENADEDTTRVHGRSATDAEFVCGMADHTTDGTDTINSVAVHWRGRNTIHSNTNQQRCLVAISTTTLYGNWVNPAQGVYNNYAYTFTTKPGGGAWTWADVNNMRTGVSTQLFTSSYQTSVTQLYAVVNYGFSGAPEIRTTQVYAVVNYTPAASSTTLTMPERLSVSHGRNITRFTFPEGDYEIADFGRAGKSLTLSGIETSTATVKMEALKDMAHDGSSVTLAGLPDSNLNTDYMIKAISWQEEGGYEERTYRWTLELEEV